MKVIYLFILMMFTHVLAFNTYTALAIDSNGLVCVGSWAWSNQGGYFLNAFVSQNGDNSIACTNGSMHSTGSDYVTTLISVGVDSFVSLGYSPTLYKNNGSSITAIKSWQIECDPNVFGGYLGEFDGGKRICRSIVEIEGGRYTVLAPWMQGWFELSTSNSEYWYLGTGEYNLDSVVNFWTLTYDFQGRLWGGNDTSVWVKTGDSSTVFKTGWPVRSITPVDSDLVIIKSFDPAYDDKMNCMQYMGCIHRIEGYDPNCQRTGFPVSYYGKLYCPRPGYCFDGRDRIVNGVHTGSAQIPTSHVFNSQLDPSGTLWMTTLSGLYSVDTATLEATRHYIGHDQPTPIKSKQITGHSLLKASALNSSILVYQAPTIGILRLINPLGKVSAIHRLSVQTAGSITMGQNLKAGVWTLLWTHGQQRLSKQVVVY